MVTRFLIFLLSLPVALFSQNVQQVTVVKKDSFSFNKIQVKVPPAVVNAFVRVNIEEFPAYNREGYTLNELYSSLHFVDLNNDGLTDVIFEGDSGGEATWVKIFMQGENGYTKVFKDLQFITRATFENKKLTKISIADNGCCDSYITFKKDYNVNFSTNGKPIFKYINQVAFMTETKMPDSIFVKPFLFTILNSGYNFRSAPVIDDTSYMRWTEETSSVRGNIIGKFSAGTVCKALGKQTDRTGREWWYIETDERCMLQNDAFYRSENNLPYSKRGWISSRFVQVLQDENVTKQ